MSSFTLERSKSLEALRKVYALLKETGIGSHIRCKQFSTDEHNVWTVVCREDIEYFVVEFDSER